MSEVEQSNRPRQVYLSRPEASAEAEDPACSSGCAKS